MREKLKNPFYTFKYHDLRATFGMNLTSSLLENVNKGKISLHDAREYVKIEWVIHQVLPLIYTLIIEVTYQVINHIKKIIGCISKN